MIFVTVGTEKYPFNRLMDWISILLKYGILDAEDVVVQSGSCTKLPPGVRVYQSIQKEEFDNFLKKVDLIIAHCGEGTLLDLNKFQKPYVLVPRSVRYQEHLDDHQMELAKVLSELGVAVAWSPIDLVKFVVNPFWANCLPCLSETTAMAICQRLEHRFGIAQSDSRSLQLA